MSEDGRDIAVTRGTNGVIRIYPEMALGDLHVYYYVNRSWIAAYIVSAVTLILLLCGIRIKRKHRIA